MEQVTLVRANPDQRDFTFDVKRSAFKNYLEQIGGWDDVAERKLHDGRFDVQLFRLIHASNEIVGFISTLVNDDALIVSQLMVLPAFQSNGYGDAAMRIVMDEARKANLPIRLRVLTVNTRAQAFYRRLGFTVRDETEMHVRMQWLC